MRNSVAYQGAPLLVMPAVDGNPITLNAFEEGSIDQYDLYTLAGNHRREAFALNREEGFEIETVQAWFCFSKFQHY